MAVAVLPFFIMERPVFIRERSNGFYGVAAYAASNFVCCVPGVFLIALVSAACVVLPSGLNGFGVYVATLGASLFTAEAVMFLIASLVPHYIIGIALGAGLFGFHMLCEGFFIVAPDIPGWFIWGHYMGFHTYAYRAFMKNEFGPIDDFEGPQFTNGQQVLDFYGMQDADVGRDIGICIAFGVFYFICYGMVLQFLHTGKR
mmetsp:Transcript_25681/g.82936  ORF Transcript_25681/g.82936 Transcript_25681/m.82936 type:complete len:201 (+) Transcript_25681:1314-1916(+)